jgi:hypothetical protein
MRQICGIMLIIMTIALPISARAQFATPENASGPGSEW